MKKITNVSTFTHNAQDLEVLYHRRKISYIFELNGEKYGNAVNVESTKPQDVVNASLALIINYLETYDRAKSAKG